MKKIIYTAGGAIALLILIGSMGGNTPKNQEIPHAPEDQQVQVEDGTEEAEVVEVTEQPLAEESSEQEKIIPMAPETVVEDEPIIILNDKITRIVDGDTFDVLLSNGIEDTIRLLGVDTPETHSVNKANEYGDVTDIACLDEWGEKASQYAENLLNNKNVSLTYDPLAGERGFYGRLLTYIEINNQDFGTLLLQNGYARVYTESKFEKESYYLTVQQQAQANKIGLWSCGTDELIEPEESQPVSTGDHTFYLSEHWSATFYYCDTDDGWKSLSEKYLKSYPSEEALLEVHSDYTLHEPCQ